VGMNPAAITINPENGMVYVLNIYEGTISVIDGFNVIKTIDLNKGADNIAFDPLVNAIYVTDSNDNALIFINAQTGSIVKKLSVGTEPFGIAIGPNDEIYISKYGNSTISVIN
jgi:YVTN family beta-propeller protein